MAIFYETIPGEAAAPQEINGKIQEDIVLLEKWTNSNTLTLNHKKYVFMQMRIRPDIVTAAIFHSTETSACTSGIVLDNRWVLTHGSLLSNFLTENNDTIFFTNFINNLKPDKLFTFPNYKHIRKAKYSVFTDDTNCLDNYNIDNIKFKNTSLEIKSRRGVLFSIWKSSKLIKIINVMLSSWRIGLQHDNNSDSAKLLLPVFVVIDLNKQVFNINNIRVLERVLLKFLYENVGLIYRGQHVCLVSTPFGNEVFLNSLSCGVVSQILGDANDLILTDSSSALGCEGGAIYDQDCSKVLAIAISALSWWRGEWVGYTLAVGLATLLGSLDLDRNKHVLHQNHLAIQTKTIASVQDSSNDIRNIIDVINSTVVVVRVGTTWGSGVIINKQLGLVLTCSHVVKDYRLYDVSVIIKGITLPACVLFRCRDEYAFDVAILEVDVKNMESCSEIKMASKFPRKGDAVIAAGYPFFTNYQIPLLTPTISRGNITHVRAAMLQTSCCVQSGYSGGAILRNDDATLLALIVCNVKAHDRSKAECSTRDVAALYPRINMAVPVSVIRKYVEEYTESRDINIFASLEVDDDIQQLWRLEPVSKL